MIERITKNEERLDKIELCIHNLSDALENFKSNRKELSLLNRYYGSKNWLKDKSYYESNKIPKIKSGVLSEDAVWNVIEKVKELMNEMSTIVKCYHNKK